MTEALNHPYLFDFHNPVYEPSCSKDIKIMISDNDKAGVKAYQEALYEQLGKGKNSRNKAIFEEIFFGE